MEPWSIRYRKLFERLLQAAQHCWKRNTDHFCLGRAIVKEAMDMFMCMHKYINLRVFWPSPFKEKVNSALQPYVISLPYHVSTHIGNEQSLTGPKWTCFQSSHRFCLSRSNFPHVNGSCGCMGLTWRRRWFILSTEMALRSLRQTARGTQHSLVSHTYRYIYIYVYINSLVSHTCIHTMAMIACHHSAANNLIVKRLSFPPIKQEPNEGLYSHDSVWSCLKAASFVVFAWQCLPRTHLNWIENVHTPFLNTNPETNSSPTIIHEDCNDHTIIP